MSSRPELIRQRRDEEKGSRFAMYSFPSKPMPHSILLQFEDYNYNEYISSIKKTDKGFESNADKLGFVKPVKSRAEVESSSAVELPFPRTLLDNQNIRVQQFERDFMLERAGSFLSSFTEGGNILNNLMTTGENALDSIKAGTKAFVQAPLQELQKAIGNVSGMEATQAAAIARYLARNVISGDIAKTAGVISERAINPQDTLGFEGVDLRNFSFSWDLFPSNSKDTEQIREIVRFLKMKSLPVTEDIAGDPRLGRAFLKYPSIVKINLLGVDESHFTQFKRCMVSNVSVDYGGGGQVAIMKGGVPASVTLTVAFSEVVIHTSNDYKGSPPPDTGSQQTGGPSA